MPRTGRPKKQAPLLTEVICFRVTLAEYHELDRLGRQHRPKPLTAGDMARELMRAELARTSPAPPAPPTNQPRN